MGKPSRQAKGLQRETLRRRKRLITTLLIVALAMSVPLIAQAEVASETGQSQTITDLPHSQ